MFMLHEDEHEHEHGYGHGHRDMDMTIRHQKIFRLLSFKQFGRATISENMLEKGFSYKFSCFTS
jgi:hypothetical protein